MKKISVITINYNDKVGLEKTIKSVLDQTATNFEFVIIDGKSTDGSTKIIENYKSKIDYWISEKDSGVYNAMNKGIKNAEGEFVIFMNSGDVFNNKNVLTDVTKYLTPNFDIYYGDNYKIKADGKRKKTYPSQLSFSFFYNSSINHQSTFIRKDLFEKHFYYNENYKIVSDWEFFIYTICKINVPYKYLPITICDYDFTGISSLAKYQHIAQYEKMTTIKKFFPLFENDYKQLAEVNSKRIQQILHIRNHKIAWKILKIFTSIIQLFLPKFKQDNQ
ncbi:MAG: glycosyltransferase [Flavobacterium sp.]|nr:glycosyltransferase [Flavobacterium sp.]